MLEMEHSPLGGSSAKRFLSCRGSFLLQRLLMLQGEYETPPSSHFASKGAAAHELGATCLTVQREPFEFIGKEIGQYKVHPDDLDPGAVAVYVAFCEAIAAASRGDINAFTLIEKTLHLPEIHPLFKGTVDFGHWRLNRNPGLWLIDYKNGEGIGVETVGNPQLLYYALLLIMAFELWKHGAEIPVYLGICQPNFYGLFEEPILWETSIGEIMEWGMGTLIPAMHSLTEDKREELSEDDFVDGEHCQFCPVMLECPKLRSAFETYAYGEEFFEMLSDEEIGALYKLRDGAKKYGSELEKVVFARMIGGKTVPNAKLVEKRVNRVFREGAESAAVERFGEVAYDPPKLKSPAKLEKLSSGAKAFVTEWAFKPMSDRFTVAPASDPRPEAKPPGNAEVFKNFTVPLEDLGW